MLDRSTTAAATAEISLRAGDLHDAFARTRHAICKEQTRYYLNGVYIHPSPDGKTLNFVATDGHRLAHVRLPITPTAAFAPVLVGTEFVAGALKLLSRKSHHLLSVKLTLSPRAVSLMDWRGGRIDTEPVDCTYPDYARAVPENPPVRAVLARQELVAALESITGFLKPTNQRAVKLTVTGETLTLSAAIKESYPNDVSATAQTMAKLAEMAEPYETGFNAEYLLEALRTFGGRGSNGPVSICSHDLGAPHVLACDSHETYVLMPMRVG
jgi:DNA polymerase III subunit beta